MSDTNDPSKVLDAASDLITVIDCFEDKFERDADFARISERARLLGDALTAYYKPAWAAELKRRLEAVENGETRTVPLEEVFDKLGIDRSELTAPDPDSLKEGFCYGIRERLKGIQGILGVYVHVLNGDVTNGGDIAIEFFCEEADPGGPVEVAVSAALTELRRDVPKMQFFSSLREWPKSALMESFVARKES